MENKFGVFLIYFFEIMLIVGCSQVQPTLTATAIPKQTNTSLPIATLTSKPTSTPLSTFTSPPPSIALPAFTPIPSPAPIPISTATEIFQLDNLRMAYMVDGNLYVQNGSSSPKQLSNSGEDISPMFSDVGEKIVFYRGKIHDNNSIFSVNADGSQMQEIITTAWLDTLGAGTKAGHLAFVPNTHLMIFNTYLCPDNDDLSSGCTVGLFLVDTDTGKLKEIVKPTLGGRLPIGGDALWIRNFSISPDGKSLSIAHAGQIDIFDINGKVIHHSIMTYSPGMPFELYPRVYWFPDSSGLIVALPAETEYVGPLWGGDPDYTIWRYIFDGNIATQIPLEPTPTWIHMLESNDVLSVSPNREWVIYFANDCKLYKGNLLDGSTELLIPCWYFLPMQWSSDNKHFGSGSNPQAIIGSVDKPLGLLPGYFIDWIDAKRFIYFSSFAENTQILVGEINQGILLSYKSNVTVPPKSYVTFTLINNK